MSRVFFFVSFWTFNVFDVCGFEYEIYLYLYLELEIKTRHRNLIGQKLERADLRFMTKMSKTAHVRQSLL